MIPACLTPSIDWTGTAFVIEIAMVYCQSKVDLANVSLYMSLAIPRAALWQGIYDRRATHRPEDPLPGMWSDSAHTDIEAGDVERADESNQHWLSDRTGTPELLGTPAESSIQPRGLTRGQRRTNGQTVYRN